MGRKKTHYIKPEMKIIKIKLLLYLLPFIFLLSCNVRNYNCIVSADYSRYLVVNVENPISIGITGLKWDNIEVESSDCKVIKYKKKGCFGLEPYTTGRCTILIKYGKNKSESLSLRVKDMAPLVTMFCCGFDSASKRRIKDEIGLRVITTDFDYRAEITKMSYKLRVYRSDSLIGESYNEGNGFTKETKELIEKSQKGDKLHFEDILVIFPNGNTMMAKPLVVEMEDE